MEYIYLNKIYFYGNSTRTQSIEICQELNFFYLHHVPYFLLEIYFKLGKKVLFLSLLNKTIILQIPININNIYFYIIVLYSTSDNSYLLIIKKKSFLIIKTVQLCNVPLEFVLIKFND